MPTSFIKPTLPNDLPILWRSENQQPVALFSYHGALIEAECAPEGGKYDGPNITLRERTLRLSMDLQAELAPRGRWMGTLEMPVEMIEGAKNQGYEGIMALVEQSWNTALAPANTEIVDNIGRLLRFRLDAQDHTTGILQDYTEIHVHGRKLKLLPKIKGHKGMDLTPLLQRLRQLEHYVSPYGTGEDARPRLKKYRHIEPSAPFSTQHERLTAMASIFACLGPLGYNVEPWVL